MEFIASGPTVPAHTNQADAIDVLTRHKIDVLDELLPWLSDPKSATPAPDAACFDRVSTTIVAAPSQSLKAAQEFLEARGWSAGF